MITTISMTKMMRLMMITYSCKTDDDLQYDDVDYNDYDGDDEYDADFDNVED